MKLCMGCMNQIEDHLSACPHCGFNEHTLRQESYYLDPGTVVGGKYIVGRVLNYGGFLSGNGCREKPESHCKRISSE